MGQAEKSALKRFGRNVFALLLSGVVAYTTEKPYLVGLAPVINSVAKWLRNKFGLKYTPV